MSYSFTPEQMCLLNLARTSWWRRASAKVHRLQFGEESITETILLDLADRFPGDVFILPFNKTKEGKYGADWAWAFQSADGAYVLPMLVQAKVLALDDQNYPEIKRPIGRSKPKIRQIDRLITTARDWGWPAIYAFYNHLSDPTRVPERCKSIKMAGFNSIPESWGISIADAYDVRAVLDDQSFDTHSGHSIAFHCLLCSSGFGLRPLEGSPGLALRALRQLRKEQPRTASDGEYPSLPDVPFRDLPQIFYRAQEIVFMSEGKRRARQRRLLAREYPQLAGVVLLRDGVEEGRG